VRNTTSVYGYRIGRGLRSNHRVMTTPWFPNFMPLFEFTRSRTTGPGPAENRAVTARVTIVLEVGPGAGRWTEILRSLASHLVLVDASRACLEVCQERFGSGSDIEYHLIDADGVADVGAESIDVVWSYDVFVQINPTDVNRYLPSSHEYSGPVVERSFTTRVNTGKTLVGRTGEPR